MTNFNLYSFISNHVLPRTNTNDITANHNAKENFNNFTSKEAIQQLYPCEDRHSFNPHYQHNLHSTSPYSSPPSLSSSPTNSSPSSTTSSASSHLLLNSGHRPHYQYNHHPSKRSVSHSGWHHHQQQQQQRQRQQHQHHNRSNSYNRQHTKRQSQDYRHHNNQQYLDALDDDLVVGYDGQRIFYESGACSMARVHPSGSPSYSSYPSDSSTTFGGRHQQEQQNQQRWSSQISWAENENTAPSASQSLSAAATAATTAARPMHASTPDTINNHNHIQSGQNSATSLLPRISEATVHENNETVVVAEGDNAATLGPQKTSSKSKSDARMTARYSLMRIVQCDVRHNDWCPQQSGQWTRHYAGTRSLGVKADGRRTGRL